MKYHQLSIKQKIGNEIIHSTEVSKSNFKFYDAYILVRGNITVVAAPAIKVAFKNCAPYKVHNKSCWNSNI